MQKSSLGKRGCKCGLMYTDFFLSTTHECSQHQEEVESFGKEDKISIRMRFLFSKSSYEWFGFTLLKEGGGTDVRERKKILQGGGRTCSEGRLHQNR